MICLWPCQDDRGRDFLAEHPPFRDQAYHANIILRNDTALKIRAGCDIYNGSRHRRVSAHKKRLDVRLSLWGCQPVPRDAVSTWRLTPRVILISRANPVKYVYPIRIMWKKPVPQLNLEYSSQRLLHKDNIYFIPRKCGFQPDGSHHSHHEWFKENLF